MTAEGRDGFGICLGFDDARAVVSVQGDLDAESQAFFEAVMAMAIPTDRSVVLDLADVRFLDAAGARVIWYSARRLRADQRALVVRSAPRMTKRVLRVTGVAPLVTFEADDDAGPSLGTEESVDDHSVPVGGRELDLIAALTRVGTTPASHAVIDAALRLVVQLARETVVGADGVSVSLERDGRLATVASTDDTVEQADSHQYETGEGPCLSAKRQGRWFHAESLAEEARWPVFVPLAIDRGIASILSTPLVSAGGPVGSLNIYSRTERAFGPRQQELAALFASQASGILIDGQADASEEQISARISEALDTRATIAHAEGVLMARRRVGPHDATLLLFHHARTAELTVLEQAREIVADASAGHTGAFPRDDDG